MVFSFIFCINLVIETPLVCFSGHYAEIVVMIFQLHIFLVFINNKKYAGNQSDEFDAVFLEMTFETLRALSCVVHHMINKHNRTYVCVCVCVARV